MVKQTREIFCKRPCKDCGKVYLVLGTGRKFCIECDPKVKTSLRRRGVKRVKANLTEKQMVMLIDLQNEFMKFNQAILDKQWILDELAKMAESEKILARILEEHNLDANGRPKTKAPVGMVSTEATKVVVPMTVG
jgi:hypothetical protein